MSAEKGKYMTELSINDHQVVARTEWLENRQRLLEKEKEYTRLGDQLSAQRRRLPWVKVERSYLFEGPEGQETLADLFDGRSQLIVYHFMFGPGWEEGCPSCSMVADHFDTDFVHLARRDVTLAAVSRAPIAEIEAFKKRMGWRFKWVSSHGNEFNHDYRVSFTKAEMTKSNYYNFGTSGFPNEEAPGTSVFYQNGSGDIFHTYSSYARGSENLLGVYHYLDLVPKGRDEAGLPWPMAWLRHHDRYSESA
jgi:predicted dithiol-disulfide oxidoreductase (DUF899 family)